MQLFRPFDSPPTIFNNYAEPTDVVISLEKIDTMFDRDWSVKVFKGIASEYDRVDLIRTYIVKGEDIGSTQHPSSKFFMQIC